MTTTVNGSTTSRTAPDFFRAVVDSSPSAIIVLAADLRCMYVNRRAASLLERYGGLADSHIGKRAADLLPDVFSVIEPAIHEVFRSGTCPLPGQVAWSPVPQPGEPGHWSVGLYPLLDGDQVAAVCTVLNDVTDQVLAEKQLARTILELETVLEVVPVGIVIAHDRDCQDVHLNGVYKEMIDLPPEAGKDEWHQAWGQHRRLLDGEEVDHSEMPLRKAATTGEPTNTARIDSFWPTGIRTHRAKAAPLVIDDTVTGAVAAFVDITDLVRTQDELREANKVKDDFLAMVSHELRTPLTMILGNAQLLSRGPHAFPEVEREALVNETYREAANLAHIVENLLLMTRVDHGDKLEMEPILLRHICERVVRELASAGNKKFRLSFPKELGVCIGNASSVEQVIRNLLSNAIKYSPKNQLIDISLEDQDLEVVFKISDRGAGIDPKDRDLVFEPFFRANASAKRSGMGIGLSVCRRLVEAMNGRIWAEPRDGGGSIFSFALPKAQSEAYLDARSD